MLIILDAMRAGKERAPLTSDPPLPQLFGSPPVPRVVKRAYFALVLSVTAWLVSVVSIVLFAACNEGKETPVTLPLVGWRMDLENIAGVLLVGGGLFGFAGILVGLSGRKTKVGKAAAILGGVQFGLWLLLVVVGLIVAGRD